MKKKIIKIINAILLILILTNKIKAITLNYSQWKDEYPSHIKELFIESETRYKFYKEEIIDGEYLYYEEIGDKNYYVDDYILVDEIITYEKPIEEENKYIETKTINYQFNTNDINSLMLYGIAKEGLMISEIEVYINNGKIKTTSNNENMINGNRTDYQEVLTGDFIKIDFNKNVDINSILVKVYYKSTDTNYFQLDFLALGEYPIYLNATKVDKNIENEFYYNSYYMTDNRNRTINEYKIYTKKYKTYEINKIYADGYYTELDDYIIDTNDYKIYYRYITNSYIIVDFNNNIVTDENYCIKEICYIKYFTDDKEKKVPDYDKKNEEKEIAKEEKEENIPSIIEDKEENNEESYVIKNEREVYESKLTNPKTGDNIFIYISICVICMILLIICIKYLVMSKCFKKD